MLVAFAVLPISVKTIQPLKDGDVNVGVKLKYLKQKCVVDGMSGVKGNEMKKKSCRVGYSVESGE